MVYVLVVCVCAVTCASRQHPLPHLGACVKWSFIDVGSNLLPAWFFLFFSRAFVHCAQCLCQVVLN